MIPDNRPKTDRFEVRSGEVTHLNQKSETHGTVRRGRGNVRTTTINEFRVDGKPARATIAILGIPMILVVFIGIPMIFIGIYMLLQGLKINGARRHLDTIAEQSAT